MQGSPQPQEMHRQGREGSSEMTSRIVTERLKNGQCIHCSIQTHQVNSKRMGLKRELIPLTVPGQVENGCCLRESCLLAGCNVAVSDPRPPKIPTARKFAMATSVGGVTGSLFSLAGLSELASLAVPINDSSMSSSDSTKVSQTTPDYLNTHLHHQSQSSSVLRPLEQYQLHAPLRPEESQSLIPSHSTSDPSAGSCSVETLGNQDDEGLSHPSQAFQVSVNNLKHQFKSRRAVREDTMLRGRFAEAPVGYVTTVFRKSQTVKVLSCAIRAIGWSAIMGFAPSEATFLVWPVLWGIWRHWLVYQAISLSIAMCVSKT
ncbi:predicted protein [Phaeodactylum tricornutum CCAP 1055/1]|uniref:Uncharacterized protein n=2 Tax=Phaeodactylum tricornutum TaxID=2850 RepID=B7G4Z6_PHATC|nr:predicted protein [Phaeodactylum tricornutum CCAP 1055/1]EEC46226.1 predicted protein [Phaeodactylum tricornutum CCAP 1055/1]|eukprot:XP_002182325.1 predicted protein [Phaeodactylum tricornutum CCAP 1055/1]